jgi:protein subunit release factor A
VTRRYITGCDAVHPDRRGGQHVSKPCTGLTVIDDETGLGVTVIDVRSQWQLRAEADRLLDMLIAAVRGGGE